MWLSTWNNETKNVKLSSDDLKDEKTIVVTISSVFVDGGKFVYQKEIVVRPNIVVTFTKTSLVEGEEINLLDFFEENGQKLDISETYDYNQPDKTLNYCKSSFVVDTKNAFTDTSELYGNTTYAISVKYGAASTCGGKTSIGFYYIVNNSYTLYFEFDVNIVATAS